MNRNILALSVTMYTVVLFQTLHVYLSALAFVLITSKSNWICFLL